MGVRFLKIGVLYFILSMGLGMYMSMAKDYVLAGVHAHVNLIGWLSMAVSGVIYILFPRADNSALAKWHFWLMNLGVIIMMGSLITLLLTKEETPWGPIIGAGGALLILSAICLLINLFKNVNINEMRTSRNSK
ncbi:cbb3-type cytochrome c oxidase subunit I [Paenibacillus terrigena]|uniref:cbb3-type cytochrome c oxidase subunit I n=1 Tax=Paenibacillus terrigena TaxID=369333 RepID=UPI00036B04B5|nr:cbb3-type cytochrome c oxidase subunit I [Paenibacillus terrigena]